MERTLSGDSAISQEENISELHEDSFHEEVRSRLDCSRFTNLQLIGCGNYGSVYRAEDSKENRHVAIKFLRKLSPEEERHLGGDTLHEIDILSSLKHPNIINLLDSFTDSVQKTLVMECMDFTLEDLIKDQNVKEFRYSHINHYVSNILTGLVYLHDKQVIHRDLKPNNILLSTKGELKISDFGASRKHAANAVRTIPFACRSYRAPEILLGAKLYNTTVDTWAFGCIVAEFYLRKPLWYDTSSDLKQVRLICESLGPPKTDEFGEFGVDGFSPHYPQKPEKTLERLLPNAHLLSAHIVQKCLIYNPSKRWTSHQCLRYFQETARVTEPFSVTELPIPLSKTDAVASGIRITNPRKRKVGDRDDYLSDLSFNVSDYEGSPHHAGARTPGSRLEKARTPGKIQQVMGRSKVRRRLF